MFSQPLTLALLALAIRAALGAPATLESPQSSSPAAVATVTLDGVTYTNKGLVGFGLIPSNFRESTGDTLGGYGSAIALKLGTWKAKKGVYSGTFVACPDRGFNVDATIDYQARQHEIDFVLAPYTSSTPLSWADGQKTLNLTYKRTTLMFDRFHKKTSGLDPNFVRPAQFGSQLVALLDPEVPVVSKADNRLVQDVEGVVANADGTFWISDEYGPYIYRFSAGGDLIQTIKPVDALLPRDANGKLNFTSVANPTTGRSPNQGFEGLTYDEATRTLYAMLQTATIQDGGADKTTSQFTRLFAYHIPVNPLVRPALTGEWVVPLPQSNKNKTRGCSEIHFVAPGVFLALSRDGDGHGGDDVKASYKQADLFSIAGATDIHGTKFDSPQNPIAAQGVLNPSIVPAKYQSFVNYIDDTQLNRFGLHNGNPDDRTLIDAKWESLALAPVNDPAFPHDYFLFTASDNDFLSTEGVSLGVPFNAGLDVDNQMLVFRVTLPSVPKGSVERAIGIKS
jgi:hypothetical protein